MNFLLLGNGPYRNRGCEAIVRGTMRILTGTFGPDVRARAGVMASPQTVASQRDAETDPRVTSFSVSQVGRRFSAKWWLARANRHLRTTFQHHALDLRPHLGGSAAALEIGGDNYSLDYGLPLAFMALDRTAQRAGVPVFIWGASIGPFEGHPGFAARMFSHLRGLDGIFVREPLSRAYLARHGVEENVHQMSDPAFLLEAAAPPGAASDAPPPAGAIGLNLSPLVARFRDDADGLPRWQGQAVELVTALAERLRRPVVLVPHVGAPDAENDDFTFLERVRLQASRGCAVPISILPPGLDAAQSKWFIARCAAFIGARTHATIAALSSGVPTISLSYSVKAIGINDDLFGHHEFCFPVGSLEPKALVEAASRLLAEERAIRAHLAEAVPGAQARARAAGARLRELLGGRAP